MNANNVFIGTAAELADKLFAEYDGTWARERIYFSPSEDSVASNMTGEGASLSIGDTQYFDGSYLNFDGVFYAGCVYQFIFAAVYKDGEDTVTFAPNVEGEWAAWEAYWQEHEPDNNLQLYAAVMLLEGESLSYGAGGLTGLENTANKVTSIDGDSTDEQYPSAKAVYDNVAVTIGAYIEYFQPKPLVFTDVTVSEWAADATYDGYGYKATIPLTGATATMIPHVYFSGADALSGNYAPPPESYNGGIYLYGKTDTEITVSEIVLEATS